MEAEHNTTKPLDELEEQKGTLGRQIKEDRRVIEDENTSPSEKEAAEARVAEREEELARLQPQIQEREEALPLRERIKNIFKKYGWTLQAVVLAAGLVLGEVNLSAINALKAGTKAVGNGLKVVGKKLRYVQKCRHRGATLLHDWHHKVSSPIKVHQNTRNYVTYEVM